MLTFPFTMFSGDGFENTLSTTFNGIDEYVDTGVDFSGTTSFTMGGWFYRDSTTKRIDVGQSSDSNSIRVKLLDNSDGKIYVVLTPASATFLSATTGWKHMITVFDGSAIGNAARLKVYVDGVLQALTFVGTVPVSVPVIPDNNFLIGLDAGTNQYSEGNFDEMVYFSSAVDQAGITELYNNRLPFNLTSHQDYSTLVSWWRMGDGDTSPTIKDNKDSNDATMVNMDQANFEELIP